MLKKFLIFIIGFLLCMCYFVVDVEADTYTDLENYYYNLTEKYPENVIGTCTYVSTCMALSYYDTYLNDDIILEQYDDNTSSYDSPGVLWENLGVYNYNTSYYIQELLKLKNRSLQALLLSIGYDNGQVSYQMPGNSFRAIVLNDYFENYVGLIENVDYSFDYSDGYDDNYDDQSYAKQLIKDYIDDGDPVIISVDCHETVNPESPFVSSHSLVAFSYSNSHIYCHNGVPDSADADMFVDIGTTQFAISKIFRINFNLPHKHSNNYVSTVNEYIHNATCSCGYTTSVNHQFHEHQGFISCSKCGYTNVAGLRFGIILDPTIDDTCGTQVTLYGGNYSDSNMVTGFTRCAYLSSNAPSTSRLLYDWYSDDCTIATVTKYGTILAKKAGIVRIYASYKNDPMILDWLDIYITTNNVGSYSVLLTTDTRGGNLNGTEVTQNNGSPGGTIIHAGYSRAICFAATNYYPSINDFYWSMSNDDYAYMDRYGYIHALNVSSGGYVTMTCISKYNSSIHGSITLYIQGELN